MCISGKESEGDGQLRGSNYTMRPGLTAVVNRQVKSIQVPKPINLIAFIISECKGGYGEGLNKCKLFGPTEGFVKYN
jgi:hypothetical protein